jgi:hypothetical protein
LLLTGAMGRTEAEAHPHLNFDVRLPVSRSSDECLPTFIGYVPSHLIETKHLKN